MKQIFKIAFAVGAVCTAPGCIGGLTDACVKTASSRSVAQALVDDAQTALDQAMFTVVRIADLDARAKALSALEAAHAALRGAEATLHALETGCSSPDVRSIFADFVKAWNALAPFLALLGGPDHGTIVPTPLVVEEVQ